MLIHQFDCSQFFENHFSSIEFKWPHYKRDMMFNNLNRYKMMFKRFTLSALTLLLTFHFSYAGNGGMIADSKAKKGLYFQVLVMNEMLSDNLFNRYETVEQFKMGKNFMNFRIGIFASYKTAFTEREYLKSSGVGNVEVLAFWNNQNITLEDAAVLGNNHVSHDSYISIDGERIGVKQLNAMLFEHDGDVPVDYQVELGASLTPLNLDEYSNDVQITAYETTTGFFCYRMGSFKNKEAAAAFRKKLLNDGYSEVVILPYYQGKRISQMLAESFNQIKN